MLAALIAAAETPYLQPAGVNFAFDPADLGAGIVLSLANKRATDGLGGNYRTGMVLTPVLTGVVTVAFISGSAAEANFGVAAAGFPRTGIYFGSDVNSGGFYQDGRVFIRGVQVDAIAPWVTGDTVTIAIDFGTTQISRSINGGAFSANYNFSTIGAVIDYGACLFGLGTFAQLTP